jgi:hypothetical protein
MRDERWKDVYASIGPVPITAADLMTGFCKVLETQLQVLIVVRYEDRMVRSEIRIDRATLAAAAFGLDLIEMTLDKMVEQIDKELPPLEVKSEQSYGDFQDENSLVVWTKRAQQHRLEGCVECANGGCITAAVKRRERGNPQT